MNYILLTLLCVSSLFASDQTSIVGLGNHQLYGSDMPSSHSLSMQPLELDHSASHNWGATFSVGGTLVPEHSHICAVKPELFMESNKLFLAGEHQKLLKLGESYKSWGSSFSFGARENKMVARHIESLLQNKLLPKFVALKQGEALQVPQILEEVFAATHDPMVRAEAIILGDDLRSGTISEYSPMLFESIHDKATEMMVTTRFGTHAIDKLLPENGTSLNLGEAHEFGYSLMPTIESFPESVRESLISYAVEGFIERSMNPGTTMSQYSYVVSELGTGIYDEILGYYLKGPEYAQLRKQEIAQFSADLDKKLSLYISKDYARLTGAAISDGCAMRVIVHIGVYAYKHLVAPIVCPRARMTVSDLLNKSTVNRTTPHQGNRPGVKNMSCPQTYEQFIKDLKEISVTPIREIAESDGIRHLGKDAHGNTLLVRPVCNNPKMSKHTPTFEIQYPRELMKHTEKIRGIAPHGK